MIAADERHWWYEGRRHVLRAALDRLVLPHDCRILDAGCGSGRTLDELADLGLARGVDVSERAVAAARGRGHDALAAPVEELPFGDRSFDLVTCLDVVEHTRDDVRALRELRRVTRPRGLLLLTVPAHPVLWSAHDKANRHFRRYTRRTLREASAEAGWTRVTDSFFNAALLAPAAIVRLARRRADRGRSELALTPPWLDRLLTAPNQAEAGVLRAGGRIPAGLSLLAVLSNGPQEPAPLP